VSWRRVNRKGGDRKKVKRRGAHLGESVDVAEEEAQLALHVGRRLRHDLQLEQLRQDLLPIYVPRHPPTIMRE
jgi:hypothetical protein